MHKSARQVHWDTVYQTKGEDQVSWFEAEPRLSLDLIARTGAAKSDAIIDVGAGTSRLPELLVRDGYTDVTVLDVSEQAIAKMLARQPQGSPVRGIVADIATWQPERRYSVWHDRAVLHFLLDDAEREGYRRALLAALKPDGQAIIATFAPTGPERCSGLPVRRHGAADLQALFGDAVSLEESFEFDHPTPGGAIQRFHVARLKRSLP
jgi:trans-aconitate methyltransferase